MTIHDIRLFGDPILRTPAVPVDTFDKELRTLVRDLGETMEAAPGSGLAAPQIGVSLRVFTFNAGSGVGHLINPRLELSEEEQDGPEGCLSIPELAFNTKRSMRVVATGMDMHGEPVVIKGTEFLARIIQHETDHLDGVLFIDRLDREARKEAMRLIREADWFGQQPKVKFSPHGPLEL